MSKPAAPGEADPPDGGGGEIDGGACAATPDPATPFPIGTTVLGTKPKVAALNGDCLDDLVIPGELAPGRPGVFLIFGREEQFLAGYDVFLEPTDRSGESWAPLEVEVADVNGDGTEDLLVIGVETATNNALVLIFLGDAAAPGGFEPTPFVKAAGGNFSFDADNSPLRHDPAYVMAARSDASETDGVVFGSLYWAVSFNLAGSEWSQSSVQGAPLTEVANLDPSGVQEMIPMPSTPPDADRLLALSQGSVRVYAASAGMFSGLGTALTLSDDLGPRAVARGEPAFGEDHVLWSVSGTTLLFTGAHVGASGQPQFTAATRPTPLLYMQGKMRDLHAAELAGDGDKPEVIMLYEAGLAETRLEVLVDLGLAPAALTRQAAAATALPLNFHRLVTGSFSDANTKELWVLPSIITTIDVPTCWQVLPTGLPDDYCLAPCGADSC